MPTLPSRYGITHVTLHTLNGVHSLPITWHDGKFEMVVEFNLSR